MSARPAPSTANASDAPRIRVVIGDSQPISRDGLCRLVATDPKIAVVGDTTDLSQVPALIAECTPDILILDFHQDALDVVRRLAAARSCVKTIIIVDTIDEAGVTSALELGVKGIVLKDSAAEMLFKGVHSVMAGECWIEDDRAADAFAGLRKIKDNRRRQKAFGLTKTELEIVKMVVAGCTNREIGERMSIAENTVKSHLTHVFNKLGASSRVELALFAAHHRLLDAL